MFDEIALVDDLYQPGRRRDFGERDALQRWPLQGLRVGYIWNFCWFVRLS